MMYHPGVTRHPDHIHAEKATLDAGQAVLLLYAATWTRCSQGRYRFWKQYYIVTSMLAELMLILALSSSRHERTFGLEA